MDKISILKNKNSKKSKNSIVHFELDLDIYNEIMEKSKRIRTITENSVKVFSTFERLREDIYLIFFKANMDNVNYDEMNNEYKINYMIINKMLKTDEFKWIKKHTQLDYFNSVLSSEIVGKYFIEHYEKLINNNEEFKNASISYRKSIEEYKNKVKEYKTLKCESAKEDIEIALNKIEANVEKLSKMMCGYNLIYKTLLSAYKEFLNIKSTIENFRLNGGKMTATSYDEKVVVSMKLQKLKKVRNISEMAGRFRASANNIQRKKTKEDGMEVCGVQIGSEISRVLPTEKMLLINEATKKSFYKKYYQRELLTYKYRNNKEKSKGPIICCIDTSTSMEGELEVWSKSVAMALLDIAFKQKRDFVAILFSYKVGDIIEFNKNKVEPRKMYDLATGFIGSGTNFVEPLNESMKLINTSKYKYADIVFITDGKAPIDEDFIEEFKKSKEKNQFKMITVNVANNIEEGLNSINDVQILLSELNNENIEKTNETIFSI